MEKNKKALSATFAAAVLGAAALVTIAGGANAATQVDTPAPAAVVTSTTTTVDTYEAPGVESADDATESEATEANDGPNVGPDADLTQPGHQDADDATESEATEANDGPNVGADADLTQPGHQDADDATESDAAAK